ncbi:MAG: hypothetical protein IPO77_21345 [Acidobacteria bacterium]|nr:hypothetical protein [Acidobacteriota bacterium]
MDIGAVNRLAAAMHPLEFWRRCFHRLYRKHLPPSRSDVLLVFTGTLIGVGTVGFIPALAFSTLGSSAGFVGISYWQRYFEQLSFVSGRFGKYTPAGRFIRWKTSSAVWLA